jgi:alternate signal-mediated exported protein
MRIMDMNWKGIRAAARHTLNRPTVLAFAAAWSFLAVVGSTFSWVTSSDTRVNEFRGEARFGAVITEKFLDGSVLRPGAEVQKEVRVTNTEQVPAFVRISFSEVLKLYKMDPVTGNATGTLKDTFEFDTLDWAATQTFRPRELEYILLNLGDMLTAPDANKSNYWLLEFNSEGIAAVNGWFYYSEPLPPGGSTTPLFKSLTLNGDAPNRLKNADYSMTLTLEAVQANLSALAQWGITDTTHPVYQMLARDRSE